ncbi:arsenic resistance N-acetyltransferase ArsN2 [Candidatus Binatia bacterium]|nr:arsenic resistance N-acetyltransferase ArsN2 [Candidatus Binatia bacterium]
MYDSSFRAGRRGREARRPPVIESARPADLAAVLELLARCDLPQAGLAAHFARALVARVDGEVVGCVALEVYGRAALLRSLAVVSAWRRRGLGQALAGAALAAAQAAGVTRVYLLTDTAEGFFNRLGFERIERRRVDPAVLASEEFTQACPETTPVMWREVSGPPP